MRNVRRLVIDDVKWISFVRFFGMEEVVAYDGLSLVDDPERILC
jgi:hypothetical protein